MSLAERSFVVLNGSEIDLRRDTRIVLSCSSAQSSFELSHQSDVGMTLLQISEQHSYILCCFAVRVIAFSMRRSDQMGDLFTGEGDAQATRWKYP